MVVLEPGTKLELTEPIYLEEYAASKAWGGIDDEYYDLFNCPKKNGIVVVKALVSKEKYVHHYAIEESDYIIRYMEGADGVSDGTKIKAN